MPGYIKQILHTQFFSILNILFGFATLFLLIKYLPLVQYGEYVLIQGFIALSGLFLSQNIYSYARLHIPGAKSFVQYSYLKTVIYLVFGFYISLLLFVKLFDLDTYMWSFFEINNQLSFLILFMLSFELINLEFMRFFIALKKIYIKNYAQFFQRLLLLLGSLALVYYDNLLLENYLYIIIFGQFVVFIYFLYYTDLKELFNSKFIIDVVKKGYYVAIPLLPIGFMSIALNYTDTLMIAKLISKEAVAQYGFASQIISIAMMMIGASIVLTLFPYATEAHNKNDFKQRTFYFMKMFKYGLALSVLFYVIIFFGAEMTINLLQLTQYSDVASYLVVLAIFPFFYLIYSVCSHHLQLLKVFKLQVYIAIFVMIENTILNYLLIIEYEVMGAAYASLISYITLAIIYLILSIKKDWLLNTH